MSEFICATAGLRHGVRGAAVGLRKAAHSDLRMRKIEDLEPHQLKIRLRPGALPPLDAEAHAEVGLELMEAPIAADQGDAIDFQDGASPPRVVG